VETVRDETTGDFRVRRSGPVSALDVKIEVGGISKRPKSADFVIRDDLDLPAGKALPLWLLGLGY